MGCGFGSRERAYATARRYWPYLNTRLLNSFPRSYGIRRLRSWCLPSPTRNAPVVKHHWDGARAFSSRRCPPSATVLQLRRLWRFRSKKCSGLQDCLAFQTALGRPQCVVGPEAWSSLRVALAPIMPWRCIHPVGASRGGRRRRRFRAAYRPARFRRSLLR